MSIKLLKVPKIHNIWILTKDALSCHPAIPFLFELTHGCFYLPPNFQFLISNPISVRWSSTFKVIQY
jgi:hypothetical protein